jgi:YD repeat-containing protein
VLTVKDALNNTTSYAYSDASRNVVVTSASGVSVTTTHNRAGQTLSVTQPLPNGGTASSTYAYDKNGALLTTTDALGNVSTNVYDARGQLFTTTDASGRVCAYAYDAAGRVLTKTEDYGSGKLNLVTTYAYDGQGRQLSVTDPSGRVATYSYDREGRLLQSAQDPSGLNLRTVYTYDALGRQLTVTEGYGTAQAQSTRYDYDTLGRRIAEHVDPAGLNLTTSYSYDGNDNVVGRTDANNKLTRFAYDEANRLRYTVDAAGGVVETLYDAESRVRATRSYAKIATLASLAVAPSYAQVQSLVSSQSLNNDAVDAVGYQVFDVDGRVRYSIDALYGVTENIYDSAGRLAATRRYAAAVSNATVINKIKAGTAMIADFTSAVLVANDSLDTRSFLVLDAAGQARFTVDGSGFVSEARYDAAGRLVERIAYSVVADSALLNAVKAGTATLASFGGFVSANGAAAHASATVYDGAGRAVYSLTRADAATDSITENR